MTWTRFTSLEHFLREIWRYFPLTFHSCYNNFSFSSLKSVPKCSNVSFCPFLANSPTVPEFAFTNISSSASSSTPFSPPSSWSTFLSRTPIQTFWIVRPELQQDWMSTASSSPFLFDTSDLPPTSVCLTKHFTCGSWLRRHSRLLQWCHW